MQTAKKSIDKKQKKDTIKKEETSKSSPLQDDNLKKAYNNITTPKNYVQKSTTADIYGQKKKSTHTAIPNPKAPRKSPSTSYITSNVSPMTDLLKSSPSSVSSVSLREKSKMAATKKTDIKTSRHTTPKRDFNVTVNSPIVKRKLNMDREKSFTNEVPRQKKETEKRSSKTGIASTEVEKLNSKTDKLSFKTNTERQRTKTRTLEEDEVKILIPEVVDNNAEMYNLTRKLTAKPKSFFIDLDDEKPKKHNKLQTPQTKEPSDDDISYEDDFESYESDFDSYHSSTPSDQNDMEPDGQNDEGDESLEVETPKEVRDEENMLDSGSFDLRDRSATKSKPVLDFIVEAAEGGEEKRSSLTDEGFQEMSSSSTVSSMKMIHTDIIDRPLFIDFTKSKENKRKKRINERLKQRAEDLLSIITLHEMSYSLFEMKPISYDLYMATFGRSNYTQIAVQTFDDGNTIDVQTEEIELENKWTQHPVEFSKSDICVHHMATRKYSTHTEDYLSKFTFLNNAYLNLEQTNMNISEDYKNNPLRIYFEQKDGVGASEMLPYETYKSRLKKNDYNTYRLSKFLKKVESKISKALHRNSGNSEISELKLSKFPFSKGYLSISTKNITNKNISFLSNTKILKIYFSDTKSNFIMTVHDKVQNYLNKCLICLWDISVAIQEPLKILAAIDTIAIGRFRGATDGIFISALEDRSLHLWDLSEEPTWRNDVASEEKPKDLVQVVTDGMAQFELDREWNLKNRHVGLDHTIDMALQVCAYTSSAYNMSHSDVTDKIVGLEFIGYSHSSHIDGQESGRKIVGQAMCLQRIGILTIWSLVQEKTKAIPPDIGKAYWSKMKLEKYQTISLLDYIDTPMDTNNGDDKSNFNLNAAKRRLIGRKQEKRTVKGQKPRPKSAISTDFDIDRPLSAASLKNKTVLPVENGVGWENGVLCYDLKVMNWKNGEYYLVGKNCGEVLCCRRILGVVKVTKLCVASIASSVTCLELYPHKLSYFLAATDAGTISVCSLTEDRVLLTLDCRNIPTQDMEKTQSDHKGRFVSSVVSRSNSGHDSRAKLSITSVSWPLVNPCCIFATLLDGTTIVWDLSQSDIYAKYACATTASSCTTVDSSLALLTLEAELQIHKLKNEHKMKEYKFLFEKYAALL